MLFARARCRLNLSRLARLSTAKSCKHRVLAYGSGGNAILGVFGTGVKNFEQRLAPTLIGGGYDESNSLWRADALNGVEDMQITEVAPLPSPPTRVIAGWGHTAFVTECGQLFLTGQWLDFRAITSSSWGFEALPRAFRLLNQTFGMSKYQEAIVASARSVNENGENASLAAKTKVPEFLRMGVWNSLAPTRVDTLEKGGVTSAPRRSEGRIQWRKESLTEMGIRHVACSAALTAIVTGEGDVYCAGRNSHGQCGVGQEPDEEPIWPPRLVRNFPPGEGVESVNLGLLHAIALTAKGNVFVWGCNASGQLGLGDSLGHIKQWSSGARALPRSAFGGERVVGVAAGLAHSIALTASGKVWVWGKEMCPERREDGSELHGRYQNQHAPRMMPDFPDGSPATAISSSQFGVAVLTEAGNVFVFGRILGSPEQRRSTKEIIKNKDVTASMLEPQSVRLDLLPDPDTTDIGAGPEYRLLDGFDFPVMISARHPGRVFLLHGDSESPPAEEPTGADSGGEVLDYAAGWKHSVVLVRADDGDGDGDGDENGE